MTPKQAKRAMLQPRYTRAIPSGGVTRGWYYVEPGGICILGKPSGSDGTSMVLLTWKQIEQALAIKRTAVGKNDEPR